MKRVRFIITVPVILTSLMALMCQETLAAEKYRAAQSTPNLGASRTVGTLQFTVPSNWTPLSQSDLRDARREWESLIQPGYAGPATLESFEYFLLPNNSGMFVAWTVRIADQKDFLSKMKEGETANLERFRRQGQVKVGTCEIIKVSGGDVVKVDIDRVNGARSVNFHHWSPESPGVITVLQLGLRPSRSAKVGSDAKVMFDSITVVSERAQ